MGNSIHQLFWLWVCLIQIVWKRPKICTLINFTFYLWGKKNKQNAPIDISTGNKGNDEEASKSKAVHMPEVCLMLALY